MLGVALLVEGNPIAALPHLEQTHTPELLGLAYFETGRLGSAIMALHAALERQPNDPDLLYYYAEATGRAADKTLKQLASVNPELAGRQDTPGFPTKDVAALQTELAKAPNDPELLYEFHKAAAIASGKAFELILQNNAGSARAHQVMAERDVDAKRLTEAQHEYAEALRLKPFTSGVHLALGNVYATQGDLPSAITQFRLEAQLRPQDAEALFRLGNALLRQGQAQGAIAALMQVDKLRPNTPEVLLVLGNAYMSVNDPGNARDSWLRVLVIDQKSEWAAQAHMALSNFYRSSGKVAEADNELAAYQQITNQGKH
jgi:cytochrome c-type biogenesis protein CcmH/NrfG